MSRLQTLDAVKEQLKSYLGQYLTMQGVRYNRPGQLFVCIDPSHDDWAGDGGSCGVVPGNQNVFHCFGCGIKGDIFLAAHFLERKPLAGKPFVVENLKYLADIFGVEVPDFKLSEEDLVEMQVKQAYAHAASILTSSSLSDEVQAAIAEREWKPETLGTLSVGGVASFDKYMEQMLKFGYQPKFLQKYDLANQKIFNEKNLVFTVCDEAGSPVGFAARRVTYAAELEAWQGLYSSVSSDDSLAPQVKESRLKELQYQKPSKYYNTNGVNPQTGEGSPYYQKLKRLYGFHIAKRAGAPLWVMEGYPDATTAHDHGLKNASAIGATAFTKEHVEMLLTCGIKHIIVVLDGDAAGYKATDRAVRIIEESVGDRVGLKVELVQMPEGSDDPDRYIRLYGMDDFLALPRLDIFSWKIKRDLETGADPIQLANQAVPLIVNEPNLLMRLRQIQRLAQVTGVDEEYLRAEVMRRTDEASGQVREERLLVVNRMQAELKKNPDSAMESMRSAMTQLEVIEQRRDGYDPRVIMSAYDLMFERQLSKVSKVGIHTGFPLWDRYLDGLPTEPSFISVPGKPNQGKTSLLSNLSWRVPDHNPNVRTIFHTIDDDLGAATPRILGSKYKLPSKLFAKAGYYLNTTWGRDEVAENWPHFPQVYREAQDWLKEMLESERLVIIDSNLLHGDMPGLEGWMKTFRKRFPHDPTLCMGDNFALYHLEVPGDSEAVRARQKSKFVKRLANQFQCCMLMTAELNKESLKPGIRPRMGNIKDTQGVAYDANLNLGVYNDLKDRGDSADLIWFDQNELVRTEVEGCQTMAPRRKPILELVIDKNKLTDYDGAIWYEFDQVTAELRECTETEQASFRVKAESITSRTLHAQIGGSGAPNKSGF